VTVWAWWELVEGCPGAAPTTLGPLRAWVLSSVSSPIVVYVGDVPTTTVYMYMYVRTNYIYVIKKIYRTSV